MKRARWAILAITALVLGMIAAPPAAAVPSPPGGNDGVHVYTGELTSQQMDTLLKSGVDREEMRLGKSADGKKVVVEAILGAAQAEELRKAGPRPEGTAARRRQGQEGRGQGDGVYKPYSGAGGIREQIVKAANGKPGIAKVVDIGTTVNGQPLTAIKVTKDARQLKDGTRKAVLYMAAQHAREWITPEMTRRLLLHFLNGYGTQPRDHPARRHDRAVVHPRRQPRRLRLHLHRGQPAVAQEPARQQRRRADHRRRRRRPEPQLPNKWGYDNEGSSPTRPARPTAAPAPESEPETQAARRLDEADSLQVPGQLPLGRRAAALRRRLAGRHPVARRPDLRGAGRRRRDARPYPAMTPTSRPSSTPPTARPTARRARSMAPSRSPRRWSTCETASASDPGRRVGPGGLRAAASTSPTRGADPGGVREEHPVRAVRGQVGADPDDPVSSLGRTVPDFDVDTFTVSYGDPQPVAVSPARSLPTDTPLPDQRRPDAHRAVHGVERRRALRGRRTTSTSPSTAARCEGAKPGDKVEVWFTGAQAARGTSRASTSPTRGEDSPTPRCW